MPRHSPGYILAELLNVSYQKEHIYILVKGWRSEQIRRYEGFYEVKGIGQAR